MALEAVVRALGCREGFKASRPEQFPSAGLRAGEYLARPSCRSAAGLGRRRGHCSREFMGLDPVGLGVRTHLFSRAALAENLSEGLVLRARPEHAIGDAILGC